MKNLNRIIIVICVVMGAFDMIRRDFVGGGWYLSLGASMLIGEDKPGPRRVVKISLLVVAAILFAIKFTRRDPF